MNNQYSFLQKSPEYGEFLVDTYDSFDKVVIVNTADKVGKKVPPDLWVNAGEDKLKKIKDTGSNVTPAQVLENEIRAKIAGFQLCPEK